MLNFREQPIPEQKGTEEEDIKKELKKWTNELRENTGTTKITNEELLSMSAEIKRLQNLKIKNGELD